MKSLILVLLTLLFSMPSSSASAQIRMTDGRLSFDATDLHVRFEASAPVALPRVTSEPGAVRLRFADATGDARIDLDGDGGAIRFVRVRPGAGDATVAVFRLGDRRQLNPEDVRVSLDGTAVDIAIARSLLPRARLDEAAPAEVVNTEALAPTVAATEAAPATVPEAPTEAALPHGAMFAPTPRAGESSEPAPLGVRGDSTASGRMSLLILLALVSLAGLGLVHWIRKRRAVGETRLPITVVATHRISQRQQLVVVRALGQDHLLSIDGTRTERLCSQSSPVPAQSTELESPVSGDFGAHLAEMLGQTPSREVPVARPSGYGPTAIASSPYVNASVAANLGQQNGMNTHAGASDAVAGLLRLRARAFR